MNCERDLLASEIIEKLASLSQTISTAESCTGGFLAHTLTNVPGASAVFLEGVVSYSNKAKVHLLDVSDELIKTKGAVSSEVACAMAEGLQQKNNSTFSLATTGIAGPSGGTEEKPVGTVFLAIAEADKPTKVWREFFPGERIDFKEQVVTQILKHFLNILRVTTTQ